MIAFKTWVAAAAMVALSGVAQAALIDRGGGMIYDSTRNITWLADMNYALSSGYAGANAGSTGSNQILTNGRMGWDAAVAWAGQLVYGGFSDWRLPMLNPADTSCDNSFDPGGSFSIVYFGFNCTGGELSGLFVTDLGNKPRESVLNQEGDTAVQIANLALFENEDGEQTVQPFGYWSGTADALDSGRAWIFGPSSFQGVTEKSNALRAVAVRPGDVATSVPEPQTLALVLLALGAKVVARRKQPS
ncbi:PEP-CTERM -sorting domain protein [Methyloversatilis sp. RAC08]|uniref:PEP-CTERM sorting domain-containing protein n=1 Tax=Methyloversatilis sp. RAC08 TaxID=1842540 RepID=UPI000858D841|nr:PEP-CTERM sorting domain-containing protein [Methyloversatilis sp. RAC08]AOF83590.1 PEP-CTERM -sorting domain protein [Methyloversatilis sp. RAC08]